MSRFDINDVRDFQALTLGSAAGVLQTLSLAGRDPEQWDILEGSYNGVLFHVFQSKTDYQGALSQIQDSGGRRKIKYSFPYRDGQTTDDIGRRPSAFDMQILIHGNQYLNGLRALLTEFDKPTPGTLIHPVRGSITVAVEEVHVVHASDKRKAAEIRVVFIEHNFTIGDARGAKDNTVKGALAKALSAISEIDTVITNITGAVQFALSIREQLSQSVKDYQNRFVETLRQLNTSFNTRGSSDIPGLLPTNSGGPGVGTGETFPLAGDPIDETEENTLPALAAADMAKRLNADRAVLAAVLDQMIALDALTFHDDILALKETAVAAQDVLETGIASSQAQVIDYTTPRVMSLREVAFANGIDVNRVNELSLLNEDLDSVNHVEKGTVVRVPTT